MLRSFILFFSLITSFSFLAFAEESSSYRIMKVNHEFIDQSGQTDGQIADFREKARHQRALEDSGKFTGIRFHVHWKAPSAGISNFVVKLEARGYDAGSKHESIETLLITYPKTPSHATGWAVLDLKGESLKRIGRLMAWRVTLLQDNQSVAERKSFTWDEITSTSRETTSTS